jgi:hypothetical protein
MAKPQGHELMQVGHRAALVLAISFAAASWVGAASSDPKYSIEFHDGSVAPLRIEVPANQRFKVELRNTGSTPAEFESHELHIEKVVVPKTTSAVVIRALSPGQYKFFDDFHSKAPKGVFVVK